MDPSREATVWPNDPEGIYGTYSRIFDTRTHGWANLQSVHVNLPFADEAQFIRLHEAIRLILPIIPALAASSPVVDGRLSGFADYRLVAYRSNASKHPTIAGRVIPEAVSSRAQYEETVLAPMYRSIGTSDPEGVLQDGWLNSRGAIARFHRQSIEIRVIDSQECPRADLSVAAAVIAAVRLLYEEGAFAEPLATEDLVDIFDVCVAKADEAAITQSAYLDQLGYPGSSCSARDLWRHLITRAEESRILTGDFWKEPLGIILEQGSLARRIERALGDRISRACLKDIYGKLCDCLHDGKMFLP
jgi:gamma-glutamyl:cysteine ligase YbdK (ATP-grasp superfamily)